MIERFEVDPPTSAAFPPRELWLHDPIKDGRLEVIYDQYGLVDMAATVDVLMGTVQPGYDWESELADDHHLQHDFADYDSMPDAWVNEREFRNIASRRITTPRVFHAWWHRVFETPQKPTSDWAMRYSIDAVAPMRLMRQSYEYVLGREVQVGDSRFTNDERTEFGLRLGYFCGLLESLRDVPKEFQLECVDDLDINDVDDMIKITQMLAHHTHPQVPIPLHIKPIESEPELVAA